MSWEWLQKFFKGRGVTVPHEKATGTQETVVMPVPKLVQIDMQQHMGAPCLPLVKKGQQVQVGQKIGDSTETFSVPIHASVSGTVKEIGWRLLPEGKMVQFVGIETDGLQTVVSGLDAKAPETLEGFIADVRESGLVGLGGAGFPTHMKLSTKDPLKSLIINAAECEPYVTADAREIVEHCDDLLEGIRLLVKFLGFQEVMIGVEAYNVAIIDKLKTELAGTDILLKILPDRYPQGAEKILIQSCTGQIVPIGKLPSSLGISVMNVTTVSFLARYFRTGMPLVARRVTVAGSAVKNPQNVLAAIGTSMADLIAFCGGYSETCLKLIQGGPMMGTAMQSDGEPISKRTNGVLAFGAAEAAGYLEDPCIRCGRCVGACPMKLQPLLLDQESRLQKAEELRALSVQACMECGCCAFICPASRHLVQSIRMGKSLVRGSSK